MRKFPRDVPEILQSQKKGAAGQLKISMPSTCRRCGGKQISVSCISTYSYRFINLFICCLLKLNRGGAVLPLIHIDKKQNSSLLLTNLCVVIFISTTLSLRIYLLFCLLSGHHLKNLKVKLGVLFNHIYNVQLIVCERLMIGLDLHLKSRRSVRHRALI